MVADGDVDVVLVLAFKEVELKGLALYAVVIKGVLAWTQ